MSSGDGGGVGSIIGRTQKYRVLALGKGVVVKDQERREQPAQNMGPKKALPGVLWLEIRSRKDVAFGFLPGIMSRMDGRGWQ